MDELLGPEPETTKLPGNLTSQTDLAPFPSPTHITSYATTRRQFVKAPQSDLSSSSLFFLILQLEFRFSTNG